MQQVCDELCAGNSLRAWAIAFVLLFTSLNLLNIQTAAKVNTTLAAAMSVVILIFLGAAVRHVLSLGHDADHLFFTRPFYDPQTFSLRAVLGGTSLAVLTYIGFDGISTLSEELKFRGATYFWPRCWSAF